MGQWVSVLLLPYVRQALCIFAILWPFWPRPDLLHRIAMVRYGLRTVAQITLLSCDLLQPLDVTKSQIR